jgi:hypothetical protein
MRIGASEEALRYLLERDAKTGSIVASRGNRISRKHYAALLRCSGGNLARFTDVFLEYEQALNIATGPLRHLTRMREWLTAAYEAGELEVRDGKVDRVAFQTHFGLKGGTFLTRHAPIRALFDEFDVRVKQESYLPKSRRAELSRMTAMLAERPALNKDRLTINLAWLSRTTGISESRFTEPAFAEILAVHNKEIMRKAEESEIDPFVHGRVFPFSQLSEHWPVTFLERLGRRFKQTAPSRAPAGVKKPYLQFVNALEWIGTSPHPSCRAAVAEAVEHDRIVSAGDWEDALFAYRDHLVSEIEAGAETDPSADRAIKALRIALKPFTSGQLVPPTSTRLRGIKYARSFSGHIPSIAEAGKTSSARVRADYITFAREFFAEAVKTAGIEVEQQEAEAFLEVLGAELNSGNQLPNDPAKAVHAVLQRRLDALRQHALTIAATAIRAYDLGAHLLARADIDAAAFEAQYLDAAVTNSERALLVRKYFPNPDRSSNERTEAGLANLLGLIVQSHRGIPPLNGTGSHNAFGQFFAKRYLEHGGLGVIAPMLNPSPDACGAILTAYLTDSGANVSVGRTLDRECSQLSDLADHARITGHKARARGKPIIVDLLRASPTVQAMEWLATANMRLQASAPVGEADRLFLMRIGGRVQLMTPHWYTNWFKRFAATAQGLSDTLLVPSMIRPSVLLHAALGNDGRLKTGLAIAQHGVQVSQTYQQKWPTMLLYDANMRRFHSSFEILVVSSIEDAASKMDLSEDEFQRRLGTLQPTGLGTFCKNFRGRVGEHQSHCTTVDCWNDCQHLAIVAEVEAIATLQLWQASLRECRPDWERDRPERWDQVWLPWLCLTDVVEEKMARGPTIKIWKAAKSRALEIASQAGYLPPRPW